MKEYYKLLAKKKIVNHQIKNEKKKLHKKLFKQYKYNFIIMDILMVIIILMNFGALALTNMAVMKTAKENNEQIIIREANPVTAKIHNFEEHPESYKLFAGFIKQAIFWVLLISIYLYYRQNIYSDLGLFSMNIIIGYYFIMLGMDLFNNIGLIVGKTIF